MSGEKITKDSISTVVTKQEKGLWPDQYYNILGKVVTKDLQKNQIITSQAVSDE